MFFRRLTTRRLLTGLVVAALTITGIASAPIAAVAAPAAVVDSSLRADATDGTSRLFTLRWAPVDGATSYSVAISRDDPSVVSGLVTLTTFTNAITPTAFLAKTTDEETIYWKVSAVNGTGASSQSAVSSFVRSAIAAPVAVAPAAGSTIDFPQATAFSWQPVVGAVSYTLTYSQSSTFAGATPVTSVTGTSYTPAASLAAGTWYWKVAANVPAYLFTGGAAQTTRTTATSATRSFAVAWTSSQPSLLTQDDNSTNANGYLTDPILSWTPVTGAAYYRIDVGTAEQAGLISGTKTTYRSYGTTVVPTKLLANQDYKWQVTAVDPAGNSGTPSAIKTFHKQWGSQTESTSSTLSGTTAPVPLTGATSLATSQSIPIDRLELRWEPVARATNYLVSVYTVTGGAPSSDPLVTCTTASTSATIISSATKLTNAVDKLNSCLWATTGLAVSTTTTYKWGVAAIQTDATNSATTITSLSSIDSSPRYFTLTAAAVGTVRNPDSEATTPDSTSWTAQAGMTGQPAPLFSWTPVAGADLYQVEVALDRGFTNTIARFTTRSTLLRATGVFNDTDTELPYFWRVKGGTSTTYTSLVADKSHWPTNTDPDWGAMFWTKKSAATTMLPEAQAVKQANGAVVLRWVPQGDTALADGGTRGYHVKIFAGPSATGPVINGLSSGAGTYSNYPFIVATSTDASTGAVTGGFPLKEGSTYTFQVAPVDSVGIAYNYSEPITFTVLSAQPALTTPVVAAGASSVALSWGSTPGASGYRVVVTPPAGVTSLSDAVGAASAGTFTPTQTGVTIAGLSGAAGTYGWTVEAVKPGASTYGAVAAGSFTVPSQAVSLDPTSTLGAFTTDANPGRVLSWDPVAGASRYLVTFTPSLGTAETTVATSYVIPAAVSYGVVYSWEVTALAGPATSTTARTTLGTQSSTFLARTLPAQVTVSTPVTTGTSMLLAWSAPTTDAARGAASVTYKVQMRVQPTPSTSEDWGSARDFGPFDALNLTVNNLEFSKNYDFRVAAINAEGQGAWSVTRSGGTASPPTAAPAALKATPGLTSLALSWNSLLASGTGGSAVTSYTVRYKRSTESAWQSASTSTTTTNLTGLSGVTSYDVQVTAVNALGEGPAAVISATTLDAPSAPTSLLVKRGDTTAIVAWAAPVSEGGTPLTGYALDSRSFNPTTKIWSAWATTNPTTTSVQAAGLTNGYTYEYRVAAKNKLATGAYSTSVTVIPAGKPLAPASAKVTTKKGKFTVSWKAAATNGAALTGYVVQYSTNGKKWKTIKTVKASVKKYTVKTGKKGKLRYFRVVAKNAIGTGTYSSVVSVVRK